MSQHTLQHSWEVSFEQEATSSAGDRAQLLQWLRKPLEAHLAAEPAAREFTLKLPFGIARARMVHAGKVGAPVALHFSSQQPLTARPAGKAESASTLQVRQFPDASVAAEAGLLIGLDDIAQDVLDRFEIAWHRDLKAVETAECAIPPHVAQHLQKGSAFSIFAGMPGTGKTSLALALVDAYARNHQTTASVVVLGCNRGNGLVGALSAAVQAAFRQLTELPERGLKVLLCDELDGWAPARSSSAQNHEDKAGVVALTQALDAIASLERTWVIGTTNVIDSIDQAIRRRAVVYQFPEATDSVRRQLIASWLPGLSERGLRQCVGAARRLTPADMVKALSGLWVSSLAASTPIRVEAAVSCLRSAVRTRNV